jgi:hypothetical protein
MMIRLGRSGSENCGDQRPQLIILHVDGLIDCLRFYVPQRIFHLYGDVTIASDWAAKFRPMLGTQGL